jgi:Protein of unknown function (DUF2914)
MRSLGGFRRDRDSSRPAAAHCPGPSLLALALCGLSLALLLTPARAAEEETHGSSLTVPEAAICTEVRDRTPVGTATRFPATVGRLYAFTRVAGADQPTHVSHVWFHDDKEVHRIELSVDGPSWRTWSYKTIPPGWTGSWRVDVQDSTGVIIYSIPFTVSDEPAAAETPAPPGPQDQGQGEPSGA